MKEIKMSDEDRKKHQLQQKRTVFVTSRKERRSNDSTDNAVSREIGEGDPNTQIMNRKNS